MKRPAHDEDDDLDLPKGHSSEEDDDDDDDFGGTVVDDDDDIDLDVLSEDEDDDKPATKGRKGKGSADDRYADYLMYRDTGSSHDEALDLASMSDAEYRTISAANRTAGSDLDADDDLGFGGGGFVADDDDDDADDDTFSSGRGGRRSSGYDDDDF